jgi:hypothetical protein
MMANGARPAAKLAVPSMGSMIQTAPEAMPCISVGSAATASSPSNLAVDDGEQAFTQPRSLSRSTTVTSSPGVFSSISWAASC